MNTLKRGDHLLATGLAKTLGDVADMVRAEIGDVSEGRVLLGTVSSCSRLITHGAYDAVINKGRPVEHEDAHGTEFGHRVQDFRLQMQMLVGCLRFRRGIDAGNGAQRAADLALANRQLATAKGHALLTAGRFFDAAIDEQVARRLDKPEQRGEIAAIRAQLESVRQALSDCIQSM